MVNLFISNYHYQAPEWFWGLLIVPFMLYVQIKKETKKSGIWKFNGSFVPFSKFQTALVTLRWLFLILPILIYSLLILAMAQPYSWNENLNKYEENQYGIDIILALDVSLSMKATDFSPNRLEVAKKVANDFINGREGDKIGLVLYAGEAYVSCAPTLNYEMLVSRLLQAESSELEQGTAIGIGLGTAVAQFRDKSIKSKVVILITDGSNNYGEISPMEATQFAKNLGIKVYTIGIGSNGLAKTPVITPMGVVYENIPVEIDENVLKDIATKTGGKYFRANDENSLRKIYQDINALEKRKFRSDSYAMNPATPDTFLMLGTILFFCLLIFDSVIFFTRPNE
ncbi:MAG: VWA domain-containing protein [Flavobacteriales bacterium]|nr:VWA domain-containing protein [Flavobacteriales bacterium]